MPRSQFCFARNIKKIPGYHDQGKQHKPTYQYYQSIDSETIERLQNQSSEDEEQLDPSQIDIADEDPIDLAAWVVDT